MPRLQRRVPAGWHRVLTLTLCSTVCFFAVLDLLPRTARAQAAAAATPPTVAGAQPNQAIATRNLLRSIRDGGLAMIPLACCSFVMVVFAFERTISLRRGRVIPAPFVKRFLHQVRTGQLNREQALELCESDGSAASRVFAAAVKRWGRPAAEMEQAIEDAGMRCVFELKKYVRIFNAVSTISPLLGLLGTVFGIISAFNAIAVSNAMGRPELLASGIGEALITTATGLAIAIPALVLYLYFISRVDQLTIELDGLGQELVNIISAEAIAENGEPKARPRRREAAA
ncbi:MAG: MotA/TolQ/ExbB proton channel family protein [Pirellulales bacterium]|nr:MotA/TolQ/ExbB proton channel family protein [Pirellulales bacterium]